MTVQELQSKIKEGNINKFLIFTGEEIDIRNIYLQKIKQVLSCDVIECESVPEAYSKLCKKRMAARSRVYLVRDDANFVSAEVQWGKVVKTCENADDHVILIYNKLDKRKKFYKQFLDAICEFETLPVNTISNYVKKQLPGIRDSNAKQLSEICECSYGRVMMECDKIKRYAELHSIDYNSSMQRLISDEVIYKPIGDITFKFTDAILMRDKKKALMYSVQAKNKQESPILTLSVLYKGFRQILMLQGLGKDKSNATARTGMTGWQIKMASEKLGYYSIPELINALKVIRYVEKSIKTGNMNIEIAVDYVIINIM